MCLQMVVGCQLGWFLSWFVECFLAFVEGAVLVGSFCFLDSSLFHVAASNNAGFEFVKFARGCLFCFEDKFDWDNQSSFLGFSPRTKVL